MRRLLSGLHVSKRGTVGWLSITTGALSASASQIRTVLSTETVAMRFPSGLQVTELMELGSVRTWVSPEPSGLQIRTVRSDEADARRLPSGLHATVPTL